jgi:adenylate cyclase
MVTWTTYTNWARWFTAKYPLLSYTLIQVNFWIWANVTFVLLVYFSMLSVIKFMAGSWNIDLVEILTVSVLLGAVYGFFQGSIDYYLDKKLIAKDKLGHYLLIKLAVSTVFSLLFFLLFVMILGSGLFNLSDFNERFFSDSKTLKYFFIVYLIYYALMNVLLICTNQVNKKYGPGVLIPLLMGHYSKPFEEERIFLFMDLKSSTTLAEVMGNFKYSRFIRDAFLDIDLMLAPYFGEVYQYVGDEVIISWPVEQGMAGLNSINFFYACQKRLQFRSAYYLKNYGYVPEFKGGLHLGVVTAVEIGNTKREIAFHGDTLNTTARIQSLCNQYGKNLLASSAFAKWVERADSVRLEPIAEVNLRGKLQACLVVSVELI